MPSDVTPTQANVGEPGTTSTGHSVATAPGLGPDPFNSPGDPNALARMQHAITASIRDLEGRIVDTVQQGHVGVRSTGTTARTYGESPVGTTTVGAPYTPYALRPGVAQGVNSRPGETPGFHTPTARGVSGFAVQLTPRGARGSDKAQGQATNLTGIGLTGVTLSPTIGARVANTELSAAERIRAARAASDANNEETKRLRAELFVTCLPLVEKQHPNATDDELAALTEKMVSDQWLQIRRELTTRSLEAAAQGTSHDVPDKRAGDPSTTKKEYQRKISQSAASRVTNKLTHENYLSWVSEIIGILAPIQGAMEIVEGIEHGPDYDELEPEKTTPNYDLRLDLEIGGLLAGSMEPECRGYVVARQVVGDNRGSSLWRDLVNIIRRTDGVGKSTLLEQVLNEKQKTGEKVRSYAERLRTLFIKSSSINAPFSVSDQVIYLLRGLQPYLHGVRLNIRASISQGQLYTFDQALLFLVEQEVAMQHDHQTGRAVLPLLSRPTANLAAQSDASSANNPRRFHVIRNTAVKGQPGYFNGECRGCRKWGHKLEDCAVRKRELDTSSQPHSASANLASAEESPLEDSGEASSDVEGDIYELEDDDGNVIFAHLATGPVRDGNGESLIAQAMVAAAGTAGQGVLIAAASRATAGDPSTWSDDERQAHAEAHRDGKAIKWILDSGATHHMTSRSELLPVRVGAAADSVVHIADGTKAPVSRRGACVATLFGDGGTKADAFLKSVLVVPSFSNNLLSVQRLTEEGWTIKFTRRGTELVSPKGEKVMTFIEPGTGAPYLMLKTQHARVIDVKGVSKRTGPAIATARIASRTSEGNSAASRSSETSDKDIALVEKWHRRLGHPGDGYLANLVRNEAFKVSDPPSLRAIAEHAANGDICAPCVEAKQPLLPFFRSETKPESKLSDVHFDLTGPYEGSKDYKYALHILDEWSRMTWTFPIPNKEGATVFAVFESWATLMNTQGHGSIKRLHCDHGGEFENRHFQDWASKNGIAWNFSAPNTSQQNGLIERWNRAIQDRVRAMLRGARLSDAFWPYAFRAASSLTNMLPSTAIGNAIPLTKWSDEPIDYGSVRTFGSVCWAIKSLKTRSNKLTTRSVRGTYLGPAPEHKASLVYTPAERPFLRISRHIIFDESRTYDARFALDEKKDHSGPPSDITELIAPRRTIKLSEVPIEPDQAPEDRPVIDWDGDLENDAIVSDELDATLVTAQARGDLEGDWPILDSMFGDIGEQEDLVTNSWTGELERHSGKETSPPSVHGLQNLFVPPPDLGKPVDFDYYLDDAFSYPEPFAASTPPATMASSPTPKTPAVADLPRRGARTRIQTRKFQALAASVTLAIMASTGERILTAARALSAAIRSSADGIPIEPKTLAEAKARPDWDKWEEGMKAEIASLAAMGTWDLTELPAGRKPIGCRWTYKLKLDANSIASRWKARLVAQGFSQRAGIDFSETFAPVARLTTVRILIALAIRHKLIVWSMDVVTAYLNGSISEDIYMSQPPHFDDGTGRVCKLRRSLYGLKQSGREWFFVIKQWLISEAFRALASEPCVFVKHTVLGELIIVVLYVDDVLIAAKSQRSIDEIRSAFASRFKMTDNGMLTQVLGLKVTINHQTGMATISQGAYIDGIIRRFGLDGCNPVDSPMTVALQTVGPREDGQASAQEIAEYASIVGCLMWVAQGTRPDIAYATSRLGRFMANPRPEHIVGAKRVLRYLSGTRSLGLVYSAHHNAQIEGFCDADHGKDLTTRRSISAYAFYIHGNLVSWRSRLQATVAISSTESEYVAMSEATREAKWLRTFTTEVGFAPHRATDIFTDSSGAYFLARNPEGHDKLKHIDIHHHFVRELVALRQVSITQINTNDNAADILTKVTSLLGLHRGMSQLGMGDSRSADA